MLLNCGVGEDFWESLDCKEIQPVHHKGDQSWVYIERTHVEAERQYFGHLMWRVDSFEKTLILGKIEAGGEGDNRGWDGWMASWTQWTWVWVSSGSWWWTGRPDGLQSMGSQRVWHDSVTELNWTEKARCNRIDLKSAKYEKNNRLLLVCMQKAHL